MPIGLVGEVAAGLVEAAVHDQRRIVGEVRHDGDVGVGEVQLDGVVVDLLDRAVAGAEELAGLLLLDDGAVVLGDVAHELLLALLLDQGAHAVAIELFGHVAFAPAGEVEDHVVGVEGVAVVPGRALAELQRVFGRVVVDFPAFEQPGHEGEVGGVAHQRLEEEAGLVAHLRPVEDARVVQAHHRLGDLDHAAGRAVLRLRAGAAAWRGRAAVGRRSGHAERRRHRQELAAAELAVAGLARQPRHRADAPACH